MTQQTYTVSMSNGDIATVIDGEFFGSRRPYYDGEKADYKYSKEPNRAMLAAAPAPEGNKEKKK